MQASAAAAQDAALESSRQAQAAVGEQRSTLELAMQVQDLCFLVPRGPSV